MTPDELAQAITDADLGWGVDLRITTSAAAGGVRCNTAACRSYAAIANEIGLALDQLMPALIAEAGDPLADPPVARDRSLLDGHTAIKKQFRAAMAALDMGWSVDAGEIDVWHTSDRGTEVQPRWDGAIVTTQAYRAQAAIAGSSLADMAQALADLVGDPTADPPVAPDSTAFDLIMSA